MAYFDSSVTALDIAMGNMDRTLLSVFQVKVDGDDLGEWAEVKGISMSREVHEIREGGTNGWVWKFPKGIKYDDIQINRGYVYNDQMKRLVDWFMTGAEGGTVVRKNITIEIQRPEQDAPHTEIDVFGAFPIKFSFQDLDTAKDVQFVEELTLTHQGYQIRNENPIRLSGEGPTTVWRGDLHKK